MTAAGPEGPTPDISPVRRRVDTIANYELALDEIARTDPAFARRLRDRQDAVAAARRRSAARLTADRDVYGRRARHR